MKYGFTALELRAFGQVGSGRVSVGQLSGALGVSKGLASRAASSLERKRLLDSTREGKHKLLSRSHNACATALEQLIAANPHVQVHEVLANSAARVLAGFAAGPLSLEMAAESTLTPLVTVRRTVSRLANRAVVSKNPAEKAYGIVLPQLGEFIQAWLQQQAEERRAGVPGSLIIRGPHCLLRTSAKSLPKWLAPTGLNSFQKYGVNLVLSTSDCYFHLFSQKRTMLGLQEHLLHALLRATAFHSARETSYALLAMHRKRRALDRKSFARHAAMLGAQGIAQRALELVKKFSEGMEWPGDNVAEMGTGLTPAWPTQREFTELVEQYE